MRVLHKVGLGLLAAKAVGPASVRRIDSAIAWRGANDKAREIGSIGLAKRTQAETASGRLLRPFPIRNAGSGGLQRLAFSKLREEEAPAGGLIPGRNESGRGFRDGPSGVPSHNDSSTRNPAKRRSPEKTGLL